MTRPETPSAGPPSLSEERLAELMVKVVDEVASPAEREELMSYLVSHPEERAELGIGEGLGQLQPPPAGIAERNAQVLGHLKRIEHL